MSSSDPETLRYFEQLANRGVRVIRIGGPFNFSRIVNKGASIATGQALLLLNNDTEALGAGWLEEMLGRMGEPDAGAVGATLVWPSGVVQTWRRRAWPEFRREPCFQRPDRRRRRLWQI